MKIAKLILIYAIILVVARCLDTQVNNNLNETKVSSNDPQNNNQTTNQAQPSSKSNNLAQTNPEECKKRKVDVISSRLAIVEYSVSCVFGLNKKQIPNSPSNLSKEEFIKAVSGFLSMATVEQLSAIRDEMDKSIEKGILKFTEYGDFNYDKNVLTFTSKNNPNMSTDSNQQSQLPPTNIVNEPKQEKKQKKLRKSELKVNDPNSQVQEQKNDEEQPIVLQISQPLQQQPNVSLNNNLSQIQGQNVNLPTN